MGLLGRGALAIVFGVVALGIDVLMSMVASGAWPWQASVGIVVGAAALGEIVAAVRRRVRDPQLILPPGLAPWQGDDRLVERPAEKSQIVRVLKAKHRRVRVVILDGDGGYGKSTLARSVCTNPAVSKKYSRVCMVRCGEEAVSGPAIAGLVNELVFRLTGDRPTDPDPETAGQYLGQVLGRFGKVLLWVDDVWTEQQVEPFLVGAKKCTRLVTTRNSALLLHSATRVHVGRMSDRQARDLLLRGIPPSVTHSFDTALLDRVISRTWHWPLILDLLNTVLARRLDAGYSPDAALEEILGHLAARGPRGAEDIDVQPGPQAQSELVKSVLSAGLTLLKAPDAEGRLLDLAVFPPQARVPVQLVTMLWASRSSRADAEAASLRDRMASLSFFTITDGYLQMHDVMHAFLQSQLDEPARMELAGLLVDLLSQTLRMPAPSGPDENSAPTAWWEADALAEYIDDNIVLHMIEAGRRQEAQALACDLRWVVHRLQTSGTTSVLADLEKVATDRAVQLSGVVKRVAHMLGETTTSPDADQFLLNALRKEPDWAQQAAAVQDEQNQPVLVSHWPLPDNAGPALRHVYKIPSSTRHSDAAALSPDGKRLAMAGDSGLFIVDAATPRVLAAYRSDLDIDRIAIARDGSRIATLASGEGTITVHDAATGAVIAQGQDDAILYSVAFAPDGESFVTTGNDGRVKLWDARTGTRLRQDDFDAFPLYSFDDDHSRRGSVDAVFSDDGTCVVSGGQDERVFLWKMPEGSPFGAFSADGSSFGLIGHVAVSPGSGHSWVAGSTGQKIHVWDTDTGDLITTLEAQGTVGALAVAYDGSLLASGDSDGTLLVWESGRFTLKARLAGHAGVSFLGFSPDGQLLYSGGGGEARAWELRKAADISSWDESIPVERVLVPPKGAWVAVAVQGGDVHIRDAVSGRIKATLTGHRTGVRNIAVAPDGTWLATECGGIIFVWDTTGWTLTRQFYVHHVTGSIQDIFVSSDSRRLFTVDYIAVRVWDPWLGRPLISMANCLEEAEGLSFAHDGSWLAAGDYYGTIWVWDADSGELHSTLGGGWNYAALKALAATPENTLLAYPCGKGSIIATWDVQRAEIVGTSSHPGGFAERVAISPDGMIRSDGHGGRGAGGPIAFSGDGQWFAVAGDGATEVRKRSKDRVQTTVGRKPGDDLHRWPWRPQAIALTFHGDRLASAEGTWLVIGDTSTSEVVGEFTLRKGYPRTLAFSPDGRRLGIASGDRITVLDATSGAEWELTGNLGAVTAAAGSSKGRHVAIAGSEGVRLWDARSGRAMALLDWHEHVTGLLFDRHEQWLAVAGYRGIGIFSLPQANRLKGFDVAHTDHERICEMVATPDGARIIVRNATGNLIVIDLESDRMSGLTDLGRDAVDMMEISPNGEWLATGGQNLSVHRLPDGSLVAEHSMNRRVKSLSWSPDSSSIIVGGDGGVYFLLFKNQAGQKRSSGQ